MLGDGAGSRVAPSRRLHHLAFSKASKTFPLTPTKPHVPALLENSSKGGGGSSYFTGTEFHFGTRKRFGSWTAGKVGSQCERTGAAELNPKDDDNGATMSVATLLEREVLRRKTRVWRVLQRHRAARKKPHTQG